MLSQAFANIKIAYKEVRDKNASSKCSCAYTGDYSLSFLSICFRSPNRKHSILLSSIMYLLLLILVPALSHGKPDSEPSVGINLPHGSITFFGSNFGDSHGLSVPDVQSSTPRGPSYVTSYTPSFTPFTTHSSPVTFFKNRCLGLLDVVTWK